jgi:sirohydrochlorin ferrochelatase
VVAGFAAVAPDVPTAIDQLRARGARRIAVGSWFLAPGLLPDRVTRQARSLAPDVLVADPLGADELVAEVIVDRYAEAVSSALAAAS